MKKWIQNLIIILCIIAFIFFGYKIHNYNKEEKEQEKLRDNLIEDAIIKSTPENQTDDEIENNLKMEGFSCDINLSELTISMTKNQILEYLKTSGSSTVMQQK